MNRELKRSLHGVLAIAVAVVALVGCGSSTTSTTPAGPGQTMTLPAAANGSSCTIYAAGHDAQVEFSSASLDVTGECQSWIRVAAIGGTLWTEASQGANSDTQVCQVQDPQGNAAATVSDDGGQMYGQQACTVLLAGGWTEQAGAPTATDTDTGAATTSTPATTETTETTTETTTTSPRVPEIVCGTDATTGAVDPNGCFWATPPSGSYDSTPGIPTGYDSKLGCTWHDNGSKGVGQAGPGYEDFTCQ